MNKDLKSYYVADLLCAVGEKYKTACLQVDELTEENRKFKECTRLLIHALYNGGLSMGENFTYRDFIQQKLNCEL